MFFFMMNFVIQVYCILSKILSAIIASNGLFDLGKGAERNNSYWLFIFVWDNWEKQFPESQLEEDL